MLGLPRDERREPRTQHASPLRPRALARIAAVGRRPLRVVEMNDEHLIPMGADASVVHGPYDVTWAWSQAIHEHASQPDGIRYRARHDDSGFSIGLFEHAAPRLVALSSVPLLDVSLARMLGSTLDRYRVGLVE